METPRLHLRSLSDDDWIHLREIDGDPETMETLGGLRTELETRGYATAQAWHWSAHRFGWWAAFERSTDTFVGRGGLRHLEVEGVLEVEVGYTIVRSYWGLGFATEIAETSVRVGLDVLGLPRLVALTLPHNTASRRVMEKVGFRYARDVVHADLAHVLYEITPEP